MTDHLQKISVQWRAREEGDSCNLFDGDRLIVALRICNTEQGRSTANRHYWSIEPIVIKCDEDYFGIDDVNGDAWGWSWEDVEFWMYASALVATLPPADEALTALQQTSRPSGRLGGEGISRHGKDDLSPLPPSCREARGRFRL